MSAPERIWAWKKLTGEILGSETQPEHKWQAEHQWVRDDLHKAVVSENERLRSALGECAEALALHAKMYPAMVKGYTLDAQTNARAALTPEATQ